MRLRNKNWTIDYIAAHQEWMANFNEQKIELDKLFKNDNSTFSLEIGCGKGQFIINQAIKNRSTNFIGMEKERTVIGVALRKAVQTSENQEIEINNLKFLNWFAEDLTQIFHPNSFETIYLNFSDPWPKAKHFKKRLTYLTFLEQYYQLLKVGGTIEIKTDNLSLYEFSIQQVVLFAKFEIVYQTTNLYQDKTALSTNIPTEYEQKFVEDGLKIHKLILKKSE